jgi:hypothetical protein
MGIVIEAAGLRAGERKEFWRHVVADTFVPVNVGRIAERDISVTIRLDPVGRMGVARLTGTPQSIARSARHIRQLDRSCLLVGDPRRRRGPDQPGRTASRGPRWGLRHLRARAPI